MEIGVLLEPEFENNLDTGWLRSIAEAVLVAQGVDPGVEMGVVITGEEKIRELNKAYLGKDEPTDVLAFAMLPGSSGDGELFFATPPDGINHLGEVIINYPRAVEQAREHRHPIEKEIAVLIIHGTLHLLGYDHDEPEAAQNMKSREIAILNCVEGKRR
ncbi:MAG: rRNA maturation RNase YbeY [Dehalococcoidales bacterium]|nr:rRNA maturation RNase YbeY [Dehalococcoidales bacterium]